MADEGTEPDSIEGHPRNATLFARLRAAGEPARSVFRLGGWELHAHPDLCERLDEVAVTGRRVELFGLPGRATSSGAIYAVAQGTGTILLRAPGDIREDILEHGGTPAADIGHDWVRADAWLSDVPRAAGSALLAGWLEAAREAADA